MTRVKIAQLKTHLSSYLKKVRAGEEVIVTDRDTPIARVIPFKKPNEELIIIPAKKPPSSLDKMKVTPARGDTDIVKILREDRDAR